MQVSLKAVASKKLKSISRSGKEPHTSSFCKTSNINQERKQNGIKLMNRFTILEEDNDECIASPPSTFKVGKRSSFQSIDTKKKRKNKKVNSESNQLFLNNA